MQMYFCYIFGWLYSGRQRGSDELKNSEILLFELWIEQGFMVVV
jgi:hypothetical protein